jgi:hypothetical protein
MPLLDLSDLMRMFDVPPIVCPECDRETHQNYCRQCDEFFRIGHATCCTQHSEHTGHRIYPSLPSTPFPTHHSRWAIFLDLINGRHIWIEHEAIEKVFGDKRGSAEHRDAFISMGQSALDWLKARTLRDGQVYRMHFELAPCDLRIGVVGGQFMLFTPKPKPKPEIENAVRQ